MKTTAYDPAGRLPDSRPRMRTFQQWNNNYNSKDNNNNNL